MTIKQIFIYLFIGFLISITQATYALDENCPAFNVMSASGKWLGQTDTEVIVSDQNFTLFDENETYLVNSQYKINSQKYFNNSGNQTYKLVFTFTTPIKINELAIIIEDVDIPPFESIITISGGTATTSDLMNYSLFSNSPRLNYDPATGSISTPLGLVGEDHNYSNVLIGSSDKTLTQVTISSSKSALGDHIAFRIAGRKICTESKAIPTLSEWMLIFLALLLLVTAKREHQLSFKS